MPKRVRFWPGLLAAGLACLLCHAALARDTPPPAAPPVFASPEGQRFVQALQADMAHGKTLRTDAKLLMQAYKTNPNSADAQYKGKTLWVETSLDLVSRDMLGGLVVYLKSGAFMPIAARLDKKVTLVEGLEGGTGRVTVRQLPAEEAVALFKRGGTLRILCKGDGFNLGSPELALCSAVSF